MSYVLHPFITIMFKMNSCSRQNVNSHSLRLFLCLFLSFYGGLLWIFEANRGESQPTDTPFG